MQYEALRQELKSYYFAQADPRAEEFCDRCLEILNAQYTESLSVFQMKRMQYQVITEQMEPVLFENSPFYYETGTLAAGKASEG